MEAISANAPVLLTLLFLDPDLEEAINDKTETGENRGKIGTQSSSPANQHSVDSRAKHRTPEGLSRPRRWGTLLFLHLAKLLRFLQICTN